MTHKSGFVNIIGHPNVGKSSLMNALVGERLAAINRKAQTTRHRIHGILNTDEYQIVFSDTPGVLDPAYKLQESMMVSVSEALTDADVFLFMVEAGQKEFKDKKILESLQKTDIPVFVLINKIDTTDEAGLEEDVGRWKNQMPNAKAVLPLSVTSNFNVQTVLNAILKYVPEGEPYFPKDQITDKSERFIASEMIREKILTVYKKEVPYSVEVRIESFKEEPDIIKIEALIFVERESQKGILIGHGGSKLKRVGTDARKDMQAFFQKKVFLKTFVKVDKDWRSDEQKLKRYGY